MTNNNNQENKTETLNEEAKKKELSMEDLEQVTGGSKIKISTIAAEGAIYITKGGYDFVR